MAKIEWKSQEDIEKEKAEQELIEQLPDDKERIEMLENMVLELLMMKASEV